MTENPALIRKHDCHCPTCPEYCMGDCVCGGKCDCGERRYRFAWNNREIPRDSVVRLIATGRLNTVEVESLDGKRYTTDRRALRKMLYYPVAGSWIGAKAR